MCSSLSINNLCFPLFLKLAGPLSPLFSRFFFPLFLQVFKDLKDVCSESCVCFLETICVQQVSCNAMCWMCMFAGCRAKQKAKTKTKTITKAVQFRVRSAGWWLIFCFPSFELHDQIYCRILKPLFTSPSFATKGNVLQVWGSARGLLPRIDFDVALSSDPFPLGAFMGQIFLLRS